MVTVRTLSAAALVAMAALAAASAARAASPPAPATPAAAAKDAPGERKAAAPAARAIPVPEIARQSEEVTRLLRDLEPLTAADPAVETVRLRLPAVSARLRPALDSTIETLDQAPPAAMERLTQSWQASRRELADWQSMLTARVSVLEAELDRLTGLRATWSDTGIHARASGAPGPVLRRVDAVLADLDAARGRLQTIRATRLLVQDAVAREVARCEDALARISRARRESLLNTFARTTPPVWSLRLDRAHVPDLSAEVRAELAGVGATLRHFAADHAGRMFLHALLFAGLILVMRAGRRMAHDAAARNEPALPAAWAFGRPYSAAVLAALTCSLWIYPDRPRLIADLTAVVLLVPLFRIVRPLVTPTLTHALYGLFALTFVDRCRAELAIVSRTDQVLMLLEMLAATAGLLWLLRSERLDEVITGQAHEGLRNRQAVAGLALVACAVSFAAAAYGALRLARILGSGAIVGAFLALIAVAGTHVATGLAAFALRVRPLTRLAMVRNHRPLLERRAHRIAIWTFTLLWAGATLRHIRLLEPALGLGQAALALEMRRGAIGISVGDVLAFLVTVWLAFAVSAFLRFVLLEDVFPHLGLERGLPYTISSLLHYATLVLGFVLAVAALGVDLNRVTILAGAFGVGLGFGLQGAVNNFVSGLIVLLERPMRVGDAIQMETVAGEVRRIGIRSTTVHTWEGADVIVPNASLVSEKVTNWTLSDQRRRVDVAVGVAYGSAPEKVLELLRAVASAHPLVLAQPAPQAYFVGFGDSALNFELRAWTDRFDQWMVVKSDLNVLVYAALRESGMEIPFPQRELRLRR